jgi:mRNA interferase MazF
MENGCERSTKVRLQLSAQNGLNGDRHINLSQMRSVDAQRIKNKQGVLEEVYWKEIEKAVCIELGFSLAFKSSSLA